MASTYPTSVPSGKRSNPLLRVVSALWRSRVRTNLSSPAPNQLEEGMVVNTRGKNALRLARTAAELLLASHPVDCGHCLKNRSCELQKIAKHLGIKLKTKRFRRLERNLPIDESSSLFTYDPNKCVLCGKCVWVCQEKLGIGAIGFTRRGFKRMVSTFQDKPIAETICAQCAECVKVCPSAPWCSSKNAKRLE